MLSAAPSRTSTTTSVAASGEAPVSGSRSECIHCVTGPTAPDTARNGFRCGAARSAVRTGTT